MSAAMAVFVPNDRHQAGRLRSSARRCNPLQAMIGQGGEASRPLPVSPSPGRRRSASAAQGTVVRHVFRRRPMVEPADRGGGFLGGREGEDAAGAHGGQIGHAIPHDIAVRWIEKIVVAAAVFRLGYQAQSSRRRYSLPGSCRRIMASPFRASDRSEAGSTAMAVRRPLPGPADFEDELASQNLGIVRRLVGDDGERSRATDDAVVEVGPQIVRGA